MHIPARFPVRRPAALLALMASLWAVPALCQQAPIQLPKPQIAAGMQVMPGLGRTAPSAMNSQDIELDVVLADGVYVYEAEANRLRPTMAGNVRGKISPPAAAHAAVTIVYVAAAKDDSAQVDVGFIGQNVYLFAASEGLNAWFYTFHGLDVAAILKLPAEKKALYAQSVGYPPK
jgi:nitroreductase